MIEFIIEPIKDSTSQKYYLEKTIRGFYNADYSGGTNWKKHGTVENIIWTLKNDVSPFPKMLPEISERWYHIFKSDLYKIYNLLNYKQITVCVVPRAKKDDYYKPDQLLFKNVVKRVVGQSNVYDILFGNNKSDIKKYLYNSLNEDGLPMFMPIYNDGTEYITRILDTKTTHLDKFGEGGLGPLPYPGITNDTCILSSEIKGKDILLVDDVYTKMVNIDEDVIQSILDKGANSVVFYSLAKTASIFS